MLSELCALCERKTYPRLSSVFYFSQKDTEEQNTQHSTETLSQPISQNLTTTFSWNVLWYLYAGGVLWVRNVGWNVLLNLWVLWEKEISFVKEKTPHAPHKQPNRGNLTYHAPPCGGGVGGGATILYARNVRKKAQWTLCALWEKKLPTICLCIIS